MELIRPDIRGPSGPLFVSRHATCCLNLLDTNSAVYCAMYVINNVAREEREALYALLPHESVNNLRRAVMQIEGV